MSDTHSTPSFSAGQPPKLLDRLKARLAARGVGPDMQNRYGEWCRQFIVFHGKRHPAELGAAQVAQFLEGLRQRRFPVRWRREARDALGFLYREEIGRVVELPALGRESAAAETSWATAAPASGGPGGPRLLDQVRARLRLGHYSMRTEECYVTWMCRYIRFHGKRHPLEMGGREVQEFLTHLAVKERVSASTQNQAFNALLFLYQQVLQVELPRLDAVRARRPQRLPVVLSRPEVRVLLDAIAGYDGLYQLLGRLLYGTGLRLFEGCGMRVKDLDLGRMQLMVREGKGNKDRVVMVPRALRQELEQQVEARRVLQDRDLARGVAYVPLPDALARKYPNAV